MLKDLLQKRDELQQQMAVLQEHLSAINIDIEHVVAGKLAELRQLQGKEFGTVNLLIDGIKVVEVIPKKVEWDQEKMLGLFDAIMQAGDKPSNYMRMKLEVPEKIYDGFVPEVKAMFDDCRTVKPGKPSLKFEEATNA